MALSRVCVLQLLAMKTLLLAVLLSMMQAAPPVPIQVADSANQSADKGHKKAGEHAGNITPTPPERIAEKGVGERNSSDKQTSANAEQFVTIRELPPVSTIRDWMDKAGLAFSAILVVVGLVGVCAAYRTLRAIERQASIMRRQTRHIARQALSMRRQTTHLRNSVIQARKGARAAKASADALANIERAWVDIRLTKQGHAVYFLEITNVGRTVAHIKEYSLSPAVNPPNDVAQSETKWFSNKLLVPNIPWNAQTLNLVTALGNETFQKLQRGEINLAYRAVVRYASISENHESECRYWYNAAGDYNCLMPVEAEEYNRHT
jgi:hypothetical protein